MMPAPKIMHEQAQTIFPVLASCIFGLNKNSWASNSTSPVYNNTPADKASRVPETMEAVVLSGL